MAVKILVVDDSATMRKIMEMTFAGENAQVVTLDNGDAAAAKAEEVRPDVVLADLSAKTDGYAVAHAIKTRPSLANVAIIALSSQHTPYDASKGQAAGIDDNVVKPFDTQAVIDKVQAVLGRPRVMPQGAAAAPRAASPSTAPAAGMIPPPVARPPAPVAPVAPAAAAATGRDLKRTMAFGTPLMPVPNPVGPVQHAPAAHAAPAPAPAPAPIAAPAPVAPVAAAIPAPKPTLEVVEEPVPLTTPARVAPAPAPMAAPAPVAAPAPAPAPAVAAAATAAMGTLAQKLGGLGLSQAQVEGVLALSREVVEQVVWEVVPDLAETIIREEIRRLTAE